MKEAEERERKAKEEAEAEARRLEEEAAKKATGSKGKPPVAAAKPDPKAA
jgi:vacuolar-type H+-ATPase subunit H